MTISQFRFPTAVSRTLGLRLTAVVAARAILELDTDPAVHGNQQGTVSGGLLTELAAAAVGTAHATVVGPDESFTTLESRAVFLRPVGRDTLRAHAFPTHSEPALTHYRCDVTGSDGQPVAVVTAIVATWAVGAVSIGG